MRTYGPWYLLFGHVVLIAALYLWIGDYSTLSSMFVGFNGILGVIGLIYTACEHIYKVIKS